MSPPPPSPSKLLLLRISHPFLLKQSTYLAGQLPSPFIKLIRRVVIWVLCDEIKLVSSSTPGDLLCKREVIYGCTVLFFSSPSTQRGIRRAVAGQLSFHLYVWVEGENNYNMYCLLWLCYICLCTVCERVGMHLCILFRTCFFPCGELRIGTLTHMVPSGNGKKVHPIHLNGQFSSSKFILCLIYR